MFWGLLQAEVVGRDSGASIEVRPNNYRYSSYSFSGMILISVLHQDPGLFITLPSLKMLPCLRRVLRPAFSLTADRGLSKAGHRSSHPPAVLPDSPVRLPALVQRCYLGTHPLKEPVEPLNSPSGAKDFIYSLHPSERSCLLRELHKFESMAIAQGMRSPSSGFSHLEANYLIFLTLPYK